VFHFNFKNKPMKSKLLAGITILLLSGWFCHVEAQTISIKGTVTSLIDNAGLPGVNVVIKGTSSGTVTNAEGKYQIEVSGKEAILVFSFIGFQTEEEGVDDRHEINVQLVEDLAALDEVVVIGYGRIKKSDLTGAVSSVKSDDLKNLPMVSFDQALQGKASGVQISGLSGAPGVGTEILIRGIGSLNRSSSPLFVVDGVPIDNTEYTSGMTGNALNPLAAINPEDIESIDILKDPASCAIYGSRGANGVVMITTKSGKGGKNKLELSMNYGISEIKQRYNMLNSSDYQQLIYEGLRKSRVPLSNPKYISDAEVENYNTDWQEEIFRPAPTFNVFLNASGSNEKSNYFISGGYNKVDGTVIGTAFDRFTLTANNDVRMGRFSMGGSINSSYTQGTRQKNNSGQTSVESNATTGPSVISAALQSSPVYPVYDSTGNYAFDSRNRGIPNPVQLANERSLAYNNSRMLLTGYVDIELFKDLIFKTQVGADISSLKENYFWADIYYPDGTKMKGSGITNNTHYLSTSWVLTNTLNYYKEIGNHNITLMAGHEASKSIHEGTYVEMQSIKNPDVTTFAGAEELTNASSWYNANTLESYFGRANYSYKNKYLVQGNLRWDGSSRFGPESRWGFFPAFSAGWNMAKEGFFESLSRTVNELKLRFSWGVTGNQLGPDYGWRGLVTYKEVSDWLDGEDNREVLNYLGKIGARYTSLSNYFYSWEEHVTTNIGFDIGLFGNRIFLSAEYYKKNTNNVILDVQLPINTGVVSAIDNAGKLTNSGFEFNMTSHNTRAASQVKWTTSFNITTNQFNAVELGTDSLWLGNNILIEGVGLKMYAFERYPDVDTLTGYVKLVDQNGDGSISYGAMADRRTFGNPFPKFYGGIGNHIEYKGFDLDFFFQFVYGNQIYNSTRQSMEDLFVPSGLVVAVNNTQEAFDNRWLQADVKDEEGNILWPRNIYTASPTTNFNGANIDQREGHNGWIEDGSFIRLKTLSFGYTLPVKYTTKILMERLRVFFSGSNLLTFTNYSGYDPDVVGGGLFRGTDASSYPNPRVLTIGINATF
jgi:TonB-linked SusC/RagA family outer membrane protein